MTPLRAALFVAGLTCAGGAIAGDAASDKNEAPADKSAAPTDEVVVKSLGNTTARVAPDAAAATAFDLPAGTELIWVAQQQSGGFYRTIRTDKGPQGWIAASDLQIARHQPWPIEPKTACVADMSGCPARGCAEQGEPEAIANELKRTPPIGELRATLDFSDFAQLQRVADMHAGQGSPDLSVQQRAAMANVAVKGGAVSEGDRVRVFGYIAKSDSGLHVNAAGESVNCALKNPKDNDIHIPIVAEPGDGEWKGIVVEMIPQDRRSGWNVDALKKIQAQAAQVWIEGGLSYDKVHYVNSDSAHALKDEPWRMSLWEIHPITKFLVCRKDHCDPDSEKDWSPLDESKPVAAQ